MIMVCQKQQGGHAFTIHERYIHDSYFFTLKKRLIGRGQNGTLLRYLRPPPEIRMAANGFQAIRRHSSFGPSDGLFCNPKKVTGLEIMVKNGGGISHITVTGIMD